ncbi:MAG: hypothetical protein ABUS79_14660, partial [Pseudomonadota bacterium]
MTSILMSVRECLDAVTKSKEGGALVFDASSMLLGCFLGCLFDSSSTLAAWVTGPTTCSMQKTSSR